ncbi:MAG: insulinase family protein [Candidatus Krumholzibacteria bacterium]|nr:insulinase family protein [Candidatus Krumholzibacteria bacterium]
MPARNRILTLVAAAALLLVASGAVAQTYLDLEGQIQEFTLDNGVHFIVLENHDVPVFSFHTFVNVGSANEVRGITGLSHILEHMAFKGTSEIGTNDKKAEKKAMAIEDETFAALKVERLKGATADSTRLAELEAAFTAAKDAAREFVVTNEFGQIVENNGGQGLNAYTSTDVTVYLYNFPSNRLELWAYLEGSRMSDPVLREFYTEKDGPVTEERRMRTDNNPIGRLIEQFQNLMFMANGYHHSTIGYMSDIQNISRDDCRNYFNENYVGSNIVVTLVGDVQFDEVQKYAKKYFSAIPAGNPQPVETFEPKQLGEKRMVLMDPAQPVFVAGYHIENVKHPDWPVYEVIADVLGQGRTSRLYKSLVKDQQIAVQAMTFPGFPGQKYQTGLICFAVPVKGKTGADMESAVFAEIDKIATEGITAEELEAVKQRTRANFIRGLRGNSGMASQLAWHQTYNGDWRDLFKEVEEIEAVTLEDVKRVAGEIFVKTNRTVAIIETEEAS